jgi:hypothetical protein
MLRRSLLLLTVASAVFVGCGDDEPTSPTPTPTTSATGGQPTPKVGNPDTWGGSMATISFDYSMPPQAGITFPPISMKMGYAQFGSYNGGTPTGVDAGTVTVEGHNLPKSTYGGLIAYSSFSSTGTASLNDLTFDGTTTHSWSVTGAGSIPAFNVSTSTPSGFSLTTPAANATVSKSSNLAVTWTGGGSDQDSMLITLAPTAGQFAYTAQSIKAADGTYTIPSSAFASMSGQVTLHVVKYRFNSVNAGGKDYYAIAEVVKQQTITVQ